MSATKQTQKFGKSGKSQRLAIGLRVGLSILLAVVAVQLINYLVARPGVRMYFDTTEKDINSLDPSTEGVLKNLPDKVTVDLFFRPAGAPLTQLVAQVQSRTRSLVERMSMVAGKEFEVRLNDLTDFSAIQIRKQELRLRGMENVVVVSSGKSVEAVRMSGGLARFDLGIPDRENYRAPSLISFEAEINLTKAILSVTKGETRQVYFTTGHGEADPFEDGLTNLGSLETALRVDGFARNTWHPGEDGDLPENASIVAIVGPTDGLAEATYAQLDRFLKAGGRVLVAPHPEARFLRTSGLIDWAKTWGIEISEGTVMQPFADPSGSGRLLTGEHSQSFAIQPEGLKRHAIIKPLLDGGRGFLVSRCHAIRVVKQPDAGTGLSMPLFSSLETRSWLDTLPHQPPARSRIRTPAFLRPSQRHRVFGGGRRGPGNRRTKKRPHGDPGQRGSFVLGLSGQGRCARFQHGLGPQLLQLVGGPRLAREHFAQGSRPAADSPGQDPQDYRPGPVGFAPRAPRPGPIDGLHPGPRRPPNLGLS